MIDAAHDYAQAVVDKKLVAGLYVRAACERHLKDLANGHVRGLRYDPAAAARVISYFETHLRVLQGRRLVPFLLEPAQKFLVGSLFGWKNADGTRRFRSAYIEMGKGNGKALALGTPIPTPAGWKRMGDLVAGDYVFDEKGSPTKVLQAHDVLLDRVCYEVVFDDGETLVADAEHLWVTEKRTNGTADNLGNSTRGVPRAERGSWRTAVRTTAEIARTLRYKNGRYQSANHSVALAGALDLPDANLPIEPYTLGAWLGDGDSDCSRITCSDADAPAMHAALMMAGTTVGPRKGDKNTAGRYRLGAVAVRGRHDGSGLQAALKRETLLKNKHIPDAYLRGSVAQRLALLQGLMDTDGTISTTGQCEFCVTNERLALGAFELAVSLGLKATFRESAAKLAGREVSRRYRIQFFAPESIPVFRMPRKLARQKVRHTRRRLSGERRIVDVRPVASVPVRCISVGAKSQLFLAGRGMVPTHNSPLAAGIGHYMLAPDKEHSAEVYVAASKKDQAEIIFRDAVTMWQNSPSIKRKIGAKGVNPVRRLFHIPSSSFFEPISADSGGSGPRPHCSLVDELHEHTNGDVLRILMAGQKGRTQPLTFMITNSGTDRKSICWDMHVYATEIATGIKEDDGFFSYVCALDEGDDPLEDPSCWIKANPLLGVTIRNDYLEKQVREAKAIPANMNLVKRLNFCQWTDSVTQAISRETWMKCQGKVDVDDLTARNVPCYGGLDLSRARDLTAFTLTWLVDPTPDKWRFAAKTWFFTPKDTIKERAMRDRAPYDVWVDQGHIEPVPGPRISYHWMARRLAELISKYAPLGIAADEYGLERLREAAQESGVDLPDMLIHPQGFQKKTLWKTETDSDNDSDTEIGLWMPNSILQMENALMEQRITVDESPVMNLCAASVVYEENRVGHKMYAKDKAANRIDGVVSLAMSIGRATLPAPQSSTVVPFWAR